MAQSMFFICFSETGWEAWDVSFPGRGGELPAQAGKRLPLNHLLAPGGGEEMKAEEPWQFAVFCVSAGRALPPPHRFPTCLGRANTRS